LERAARIELATFSLGSYILANENRAGGSNRP
jgi:hypothetical protein